MNGSKGIVLMAVLLAAACASAAEPSFATVNGWGPLNWTMNVADAKAALTRAGVKYEEMIIPGGDGPVLYLTRAGWETSLVGFDAEGRLLAITFVSPRFKAREDAAVYQADLEKRYGPGEEVPREFVDDGYTDIHTVVWRNDATILTLAVTYYMPMGEWEVSERFVPAGGEPGEGGDPK